MSSLEDYRQALSKFDAKCVEISSNPGSDCSSELGGTIKTLENKLRKFASEIATIPEPDLTEHQRISKNDIPAVQRELRMMQAFHDNRQWRLSREEETGNIRIFEEQNEVIFDAQGCYCIMTEDQASKFYSGLVCLGSR